MAYTQNDLNNLQAALVGGESKVRFADGREITYRTVAELKDAIAVVRADLAVQAGNSAPRVTYASFSRD